jgi:hypothetical protein
MTDKAGSVEYQMIAEIIHNEEIVFSSRLFHIKNNLILINGVPGNL